ncbi:carbohydrate ABC transporter permease [Streptomyces sp. NBC_00059]|uniref:carbohydrate ABC transporter permease n=1 Tax=unclassified Streptomyces TaxID=2593676 RepID=UPI002258B603|nr:carbohydrate ABC transporter permease [Streptomyces sp. NBC_00059]MCX5415944.1 carbohydrate ABC transporter permease [Streptomyces sp. NBC_00059]
MTTDHLTHETAVSSPAPTPAPTRERRRRHAPRILRHGLFITLVIVALYPVLWMVVSSLRPDGSIFTDSGIFLDTFAAENYTEGWSALTHPFSTYLLNSAIVVLGSVIGNLIACSMTAYAFARLSFRFKKSAFAIMLLTIMLPIHVLIVPQYVLFAQLGWINTFLPLIVPKFLAADGFFIFLMVQFIRGLPRELDEAARIDGAGHPRIFLQIILPLMTPALATTAIFTFIWTWGDFFSQLVFLTDPGKYTVPVALRSFLDAQANSSYGSLFAMSVLSIIPVLVAFTFGQRYLIRGIATTGGK